MWLQNALRKVVNGVGGFDHAQWRAFSNERTTNDASGFIDGDLIEQARLSSRLVKSHCIVIWTSNHAAGRSLLSSC